jgi:DNA-binding response OmpR family regulator/HPt (histidine-containing phosphotransfer) domain-containing protein
MKILLVDDDESLLTILTKSLRANHYVIDAVKDGEMGWTYGSTFEYDLMVLDILLPKLDGIHLCQRFRAEGYTTPILLLTSQEASTIKVRGLDAGADDYVVKPFNLAELIARIRALLRRGSTNPLPLLTWGDLVLNSSTCEVTYHGQPLLLTAKEYDLLELLLQDNRHVFNSDEILDRLWSSETFPAEATVRSHIRRLRHKLIAAGAPSDFISTVHGRGYYLKSPTQHKTPQISASSDLPADSVSSPQLQYLAFLNETWITTKTRCLAQLTTLSQTAIELKAGALGQYHQNQAHHIAHTLAGTLGIFGLTQGMQMARHLEHLLSSTSSLKLKHAPLIENLIATLQQEIQNTVAIHLSQPLNEHSPLLLILAQDSNFTESLVRIAASRGIRTHVTPTMEATSDRPGSPPNVILLWLSPVQSGTNATSKASTRETDSLEILQTVKKQYPRLPILVLGSRDELNDRLEIVRRGGNFLLEPSITPEQIIACVTEMLSQSASKVKVMIVDDDRDCLQSLPKLLKPWGFQVTTLAEPQQFWQVLSTVNPNALILDVDMPQFNGFELCQVLRSDLHWRRLPVLFMSVLSDPTTQNQAFTVGGDDYLCKPVMGADLANRILNRLQRLRAWES